jgi:hypothetical protein
VIVQVGAGNIRVSHLYVLRYYRILSFRDTVPALIRAPLLEAMHLGFVPVDSARPSSQSSFLFRTHSPYSKPPQSHDDNNLAWCLLH